MGHRIYLTSFYGNASEDDPHWPARQQRLHQSALDNGGVDKIIPWNADKLAKTTFAAKHQDILQLKRGYGYWLWKPFIILHALEQIDEGDFLVYHDVGRPQRQDPTRGYTLERDISPLVRWAERHDGIYPGVLMPHHGKQKHWTKRDCFVLMDCDSECFWETPQVQATYNIWKNTSSVRAFVKQWLAFCCDPRILTDKDNTQGKTNFSGFREHRHDQSVLTNLCIRDQLAVYGADHQQVLLHRNLNSLIRHARKDELEAEQALQLRRIFTSSDRKKFDRSIIRWIELYYAERRLNPISVLLVGEHNAQIWHQYFPAGRIKYLNETQSIESGLERFEIPRFDLVVINVDDPKRQLSIVAKTIPLLSHHGLVICGPVKKSWDKLPVDHLSALALVRDFWKNKCLTHNALDVNLRGMLNSRILMTFTAWDSSGESGNAYFISHDS